MFAKFNPISGPSVKLLVIQLLILMDVSSLCGQDTLKDLLPKVDSAVRLAYIASCAQQLAFVEGAESATGKNVGLISTTGLPFVMEPHSQASFLYGQSYRELVPLLQDAEKLDSPSKIKVAAVLSRVAWWVKTQYVDLPNNPEDVLPRGVKPLDLLALAHKLSPNSPIILFKLAIEKARVEEQKTPEIIALFRRVLELKPDCPEAYLEATVGTPQFDSAQFRLWLKNFSPELAHFSRAYPAPLEGMTLDDGELQRKQYYPDSVNVCAFSFNPEDL